jgi:hypothetical protein
LKEPDHPRSLNMWGLKYETRDIQVDLCISIKQLKWNFSLLTTFLYLYVSGG